MPSAHQPAIHVVSGYQFRELARPGLWRARCERHAEELGLLGTVLLAGEGINFSLAGPARALDAWLDWLASNPGFDQPVVSRQKADHPPFQRLRVRLRDEIVTFDVEVRPNTDPVPRRLDPAAWNECIGRSDVQLVDTRNDYEFQLGSFDGARNPGTDSFGGFKRYCQQALDRTRPVAIFCTGGVRCEKAGPWLMKNGFEQVYLLDGGILGYLDRCDAQDSRWHGECFVFDDRVSVNAALKPTGRRLCRGCREPAEQLDAAGNPSLDAADRCLECDRLLSPERAASLRERARQVRLQAARTGGEVSA